MATKVYALLTVLLFLLTACAPATPGGAPPQPPSQTPGQAPTIIPSATAQSSPSSVIVQATKTTGGGQPTATGDPTSRPKGSCQAERSTTEIVTLINDARKAAGLSRLNVNAQLTASAQGHSDDMACHNLVSHTGSNGSSARERIIAAGYSPSDWGEVVYAGGSSARQALDWWMNDPPHRAIILDPKMVDVGAGYTYVAGSEHGGYFTVDFGKP